jgi:hypothetical protein
MSQGNNLWIGIAAVTVRRVKLRNTQAVFRSFPQERTWFSTLQSIARTAPGKAFCRDRSLSAIGKRPPTFRHRFDQNGHRVLVGLSVEQIFELEALDELAPLHENGPYNQVPARAGTGSAAFKFKRLPVRISAAPSTVNMSSRSE